MMQTHRIDAAGTSFAVHTAGSGLPLVLLHAFPLDHGMWERQAALAMHVRLIVPDQRGFGGSRGAVPRSIAQLADDVCALLDALHVARPAVVCGVSMGGYVAQHVAVRHPDRVAALVLVDTRLDADTPEARAGRFDLAGKVRRIGQRILADAMVPRLLAARPPDTDPAGQAAHDATAALLRSMIGRQDVGTIEAALAALADRPDMTAAVARLPMPALLVVGEADAITPPACLEAAERIIPRARLLVVPRAGHLVPLEAADVFNAALLQFLAQLPADARRDGPAAGAASV